MNGYRELLRYGHEPPRRLIVGLGELGRDKRLSPANFGYLVTSRIIANAYVAYPDIHDPSMNNAQSRGRNVLGVDKVTPSERLMKTADGGAKQLGVKGRTTWDTTPFMSFGGLYCDRLLLGASPPTRVAILQPHSSARLVGECVGKVVQHHTNLDVADLLVVCTTHGVEFGGAFLSTLRGVERMGLVDDANLDALMSMSESLSSIVPSNSSTTDSPMLDASMLVVGCGGSTAPTNAAMAFRQDMNPQTQELFFGGVCPRVALAAAYWCSHPDKAATLLNRELVAGQRQGPLKLILRDEVRRRIVNKRVGQSGEPGDVPNRVLQSMQRCIFSTRDQAILEAHEEGRVLPGLGSVEVVGKLADKILLKAFDDVTGYRARRPTNSSPQTPL